MSVVSDVVVALLFSQLAYVAVVCRLEIFRRHSAFVVRRHDVHAFCEFRELHVSTAETSLYSFVIEPQEPYHVHSLPAIKATFLIRINLL